MRLFSTVCKDLSMPYLSFMAAYPGRAPSRDAPGSARTAWTPLSIAGALALGLAVLAAAPHQPQDRADREQLLQQASAGSPQAQLQLGLAYRDGRFGLQHDLQAAAKWIARAAEAGNTQAETLLGDLDAAGDGVGVDQDKALTWWHQAARTGNVRAQSELGRALMARANTDAERDTARRWLEAAAAAGDQEARRALGVDNPPSGIATLSGPPLTATDRAAVGIYRLVKQASPAGQSIETLKHGALEGDSVAQFQLAMRYRDGSWGVGADPKLALSWLQQAAENGNPVAMSTLAEAYEKGSLGLSPSPDRAAHWRWRAAQAAANAR